MNVRSCRNFLLNEFHAPSPRRVELAKAAIELINRNCADKQNVWVLPLETSARPRAPANLGKKTQETSGYKVIVDLPDLLPVTEGELELLEAELADFIAELLKT